MSASHEKCAFFDGIVPQWVRDTEERSLRLAQLFAAYELPTAGPVLDIGSGVGILLPHLRKNENRFVAEVEISMEMLRMARAEHGMTDRVHFLRSDAHHLPFASGRFATAYCFSVYPHFDHPERALEEILRCLRPGGALCIMHLMGHEQINDLHRDAGRAVAHDLLPPVHDLAITIEKCGYRVTQAEESSTLYLLLANRL